MSLPDKGGGTWEGKGRQGWKENKSVIKMFLQQTAPCGNDLASCLDTIFAGNSLPCSIPIRLLFFPIVVPMTMASPFFSSAGITSLCLERRVKLKSLTPPS